VEGEVWYDSFTPKDIARQYRGDVIYCPEDDVHFPTLTVEQTLSFAIKTRTPHIRLTDQSREQFNRDVVEILVRIFGLRHARNTVIGNEAIRGVSGGEKKRVSIAEALSCRALIGAWDKWVFHLFQAHSDTDDDFLLVPRVVLTRPQLSNLSRRYVLLQISLVLPRSSPFIKQGSNSTTSSIKYVLLQRAGWCTLARQGTRASTSLIWATSRKIGRPLLISLCLVRFHDGFMNFNGLPLLSSDRSKWAQDS